MMIAAKYIDIKR